MPTPEQLDIIHDHIRQAEEQLKTYHEELTLAERAGVDVIERKKHYQELQLNLKQYKAVYGG